MATDVAFAPPPDQEQEVFKRWKDALDYAAKDEAYRNWLDQSEKIVKRYRDVRQYADVSKRRLNILWSNVQTLMPAVYGKMPKPIVERRFMDRDPAARTASMILERVLTFQMEVGHYHRSTSKAVLDYLLPGMGQVWARYEPQFEAAEEAAENAHIDRQERTAREVEENGDGEIYEKLAYEKACIDYVFYADFRWGPARCWNEVPWVAKRCWMTRSEVAEKFYNGDMEQAKRIKLDYAPDRLRDDLGRYTDAMPSNFRKAEIWEIWNKPDQTVYFIAPGTPGVVVQQVPHPELELETFWPCPEPLFTTQTNDTLVPVPDYVEYQDQAMEVDDLTDRIAKLTTAVRANGVYDSSYPSLARLLQEGMDNKLIPVDQWAAFAEKGGMPGAIALVPMQEIIEVLIRLYEARAQVKNDLNEITGMSDIVRGQSSGPAKTATEQRIKGQFASLRLQSRQEDVARFCRDILRIQAEIIAEMFSEESLMQMSGYEQIVQDAIRRAVEQVPPPPQVPQQGPDGQQIDHMQVQILQQQAMQAFRQGQQQAAQQAQAKAMEEFSQALRILRSDKLRGFRVDIETDSTIMADAEADKASAVELFTGTMQGINAIAPVAAAAPELVETLGDLMMFAYRRFRVGRSMEAKLEEALTKVTERLEQQAQNPQPNPEQIKAQAEMAKQQADTQRDQQRFQMEMEGKRMDLQMAQAKNQMELEKMQAQMQVDAQKLELEKEKLAIQERSLVVKTQLETQAAGMQLEAQREQHAMDREAAREDHILNRQTMNAKVEATQKQAMAKLTGAAT